MRIQFLLSLFATFCIFILGLGFNETGVGLVGNPAQTSLAFYYDYFAGRDYGTNALAVPAGVETVFGGNNGNVPDSIQGSGLSIRLKPADLCDDAMSCFTYENVIYWLNMYTYVHIDEISHNHPCPECASVIQQVGDTPGYKARIIPYFRYSYNPAVSGISEQRKVIELGMNGYLRKILFEVYPSDHGGCPDYICTSTRGNACNILKQYESLFGSTYQGSNILFAPTFDLRSGVGLDQCSYDYDALTSYFSCMHSNSPLTNWKGASFFAASRCTGCSAYSVQDMAAHCGGLLSWWNGK